MNIKSIFFVKKNNNAGAARCECDAIIINTCIILEQIHITYALKDQKSMIRGGK